MKILSFFFWVLLSTSAVFAQANHPDLNKYPSLLNAEIYAGFGLARDMINHTYMGQSFSPRDYDLAIIGSPLSEKQAVGLLGKEGKIVKTLQMYKEELKPSGNVFSYHYGFVVIIEIDGIQVDFKFFKSVDDAHTRGLFDVEKILIPLKGRTIDEMVADLKAHKDAGTMFEVSDPHNGFDSLLTKTPKTVNWAKATASTLDWVIRGAMITAKMGAAGFAPEEKKIMREKLAQVQYIREKNTALIKRAIAHKKSWRVKELLEDLGFFKQLPNWRWNKDATKLVDSWALSTPVMSCSTLL